MFVKEAKVEISG